MNGWVNNREAGDLRRHRAHYNVIVMQYVIGDISGTQTFLKKSFVCYLFRSGYLLFIHIHTTKYHVAKDKMDHVCHEGREDIDTAGDKFQNIVTCRVIVIS